MIKQFSLFAVGCIFGSLSVAAVNDISDAINSTNSHQELVLDYKQQKYYINKKKECFDNEQCRVLAEAVFFEARGEPLKGQYAVAFTVLNRRDSWRWPDTVSEVVHQKRSGVCMYSYVCQLSKKEMVKAINKEYDVWESTLSVAYDVYHFHVNDVSDGADHYFNPDKVKRAPKFSKVYDHVSDIGNHKFYRSIML